MISIKKYRTYLLSNDLRIIFFLAGLFFIYFSFLTISQHWGLKTQMNDLGNMDQAVWSTANGDFFRNSNYAADPENPSTSRFAKHANFILLIFVPIYKFFPYPEILLVSQILFVALGTIPLYLLSKQILGKGLYAFIPPLLYLTNINVQDAVLYDFHPVVLSMPLIFTAFYYLHKDKWIGFLISLILILILKEDMPLLVAAIGLYLAIIKKQFRRGFLIFLFSFVYFFFLTKYLMPELAGTEDLSIIQKRYSEFGSTTGDIVVGILSNPIRFILGIFSANKILYILILLLPFLFLPLLVPGILFISVPSLIINLLSSNSMTYNPYFFYHSAPIVAVLILAMVYVLDKLKKKKSFRIVEYFVVFYILYSVALSPAPYSLLHTYNDYSFDQHTLALRELKNLIPARASISVQNNLGAHFSQRKTVHTFPAKKLETEYVLLDIHDPFSDPKIYPRPYNFLFYTGMYIQLYEDQVKQMFENEEYRVVHYTEDGYLLFHRSSGEDKKDAYTMFENRIEPLRSKYASYYEKIHQRK